jgi:hypothetical protein
MRVTTISIEEAQKLSENNNGINLDITSGLTAEIATYLVKTAGNLSLNSLTLLREDVAEILSSFTNDLQVGGALLTASHEAMAKLVTHKGSSLKIQNLIGMDLEFAKLFSSHVGSLSLSSHKDAGLTEDVIIELAKHQGDLCIYGKFELTEGSIKALLKHRGHLMLPLISNMSEKIARQFKKHQGPVDLPGRFIYASY